MAGFRLFANAAVQAQNVHATLVRGTRHAVGDRHVEPRKVVIKVRGHFVVERGERGVLLDGRCRYRLRRRRSFGPRRCVRGDGPTRANGRGRPNGDRGRCAHPPSGRGHGGRAGAQCRGAFSGRAGPGPRRRVRLVRSRRDVTGRVHLVGSRRNVTVRVHLVGTRRDVTGCVHLVRSRRDVTVRVHLVRPRRDVTGRVHVETVRGQGSPRVRPIRPTVGDWLERGRIVVGRVTFVVGRPGAAGDGIGRVRRGFAIRHKLGGRRGRPGAVVKRHGRGGGYAEARGERVSGRRRRPERGHEERQVTVRGPKRARLRSCGRRDRVLGAAGRVVRHHYARAVDRALVDERALARMAR